VDFTDGSGLDVNACNLSANGIDYFLGLVGYGIYGLLGSVTADETNACVPNTNQGDFGAYAIYEGP